MWGRAGAPIKPAVDAAIGGIMKVVSKSTARLLRIDAFVSNDTYQALWGTSGQSNPPLRADARARPKITDPALRWLGERVRIFKAKNQKLSRHGHRW